MSPEQRESMLVKAAEQYMRGEIPLEEYHDLHTKHALDYRAIASGIAREKMKRSGNLLERWLSWLA